MRNLYYFVFTSGEEGVHGLDWGIKFSSKVLGDAVNLDINYRDLLEKFGLSPSLERPNKDNDVGLLLLPNNSGKLLIFIFPGKDLQERLNTIAIACNIPIDLTFSFSVREAARRIWSANDLMKISGRNSFRPDTLIFPDEPAPDIEYPFAASSGLMQWPENNGYLSIDRNIRELSLVRAEVIDEPVIVSNSDKIKKSFQLLKILIFAGAIGVIFCVGFYILPEILDLDEQTVIIEEPIKVQQQTKSPDLPPVLQSPTVLQSESSDKQIAKQKDNSKEIAIKKEIEKEIEIATKKEKNNLREALKYFKPTKDGAVIRLDKGNKFLCFDIENYNENEFLSKIENHEVRSHIYIESNNRGLYVVRCYFWNDDEKLTIGLIDFDIALEIFINQAIKVMEAK